MYHTDGWEAKDKTKKKNWGTGTMKLGIRKKITRFMDFQRREPSTISLDSRNQALEVFSIKPLNDKTPDAAYTTRYHNILMIKFYFLDEKLLSVV